MAVIQATDMAAMVIPIRVTAAIIIPIPHMDLVASIIIAPHSGSAFIVADADTVDTVAAIEAAIEVVTAVTAIMADIAVMVTTAITKFGFDSDLKTV